MCFLYILRTSSNRLYIGVTENLDERLDTHNNGKGAEWIKAHQGARLVYSESHPTLGSARTRESRVRTTLDKFGQTIFVNLRDNSKLERVFVGRSSAYPLGGESSDGSVINQP